MVFDDVAFVVEQRYALFHQLGTAQVVGRPGRRVRGESGQDVEELPNGHAADGLSQPLSIDGIARLLVTAAVLLVRNQLLGIVRIHPKMLQKSRTDAHFIHGGLRVYGRLRIVKHQRHILLEDGRFPIHSHQRVHHLLVRQ